MVRKAENPATRTADDEQNEVRTAEQNQTAERPGNPEPEQKNEAPVQSPEPNSHEDLVARLERLEKHIL